MQPSLSRWGLQCIFRRLPFQHHDPTAEQSIYAGDLGRPGRAIRERVRVSGSRAFSLSRGLGSGRAGVWCGLAVCGVPIRSRFRVYWPADPGRDRSPIRATFRCRFCRRLLTGECGESGTLRGGFFVFPECGGGVEGF